MNPPKAPGLPPGEGLALRIFGLATASVVFLLVGGLVLAAAFDPELPGDPLRAIAPPLVGLLLLAEALAAVGAWAIARSWGARPSLLTDRPWFDAALVDTSLRLALAQIDDPVLLLGPKGELRFANPAFSRLVSRDLDQLGPLDLRKLMAGTAAMRAEQDAALESGRPWRGRIACSLPDGGAAICALLLSPLRGPDGADLGMVVLGRDISREERIQTQLQAAQKLEAIGHLAGGVAHDFNNLLTVILGRASMLEAVLPPGSPLHGEAVAIQDMSLRGAALTSQLLAFGRRQTLELSELDLAAVVNELVPMISRIVGEDVVVEHRRETGLWWTRADHSQLGQILLNLVVNARDAMPEGGSLLIETTNRVVQPEEDAALAELGVPSGDYVSLVVQDTGRGMAPETMSRIFDPFFTTKPVGEGTGMGLALIHGIVTQSGGYVRVQSAVGEGTRVEILLPRVPGPTEALHPEPHAPPIRGTERILVVEDDPDVQAIVSSMLKAAGYTTFEADDGEAALALLEHLETPPHLVLSDMVMPRMRGTELARQVQSRYPELKMLLMSGYSDDVALNRADLGPVRVLQKPVSAQTLRLAVRHLLDT